MDTNHHQTNYHSPFSSSQHDEDVDPQVLEAGLSRHDSTRDKSSSPGHQHMPESNSRFANTYHIASASVRNRGQRMVFKVYERLGRRKKDPTRTPSDSNKDKRLGSLSDIDVEKRYQACAEDQKLSEYTEEARRLVRTFTQAKLMSGSPGSWYRASFSHSSHYSNPCRTGTPYSDRRNLDLEHSPPAEHYRPSIFGALLTSKLNTLLQDNNQQREYLHGAGRHHGGLDPLNMSRSDHKRSRSYDPSPSAPSSGTATPARKVKWYDRSANSSMASLLATAALSSASPALPKTSGMIPRPHLRRHRSAEYTPLSLDMEDGMAYRQKGFSGTIDQQDDVVTELAEIIACRKYLIKLCAALMEYGAPTHRLEVYLGASARALLIDAQFLYVPGAMICTFMDHTIHANNVEVVRTAAGLDFDRLEDVFNVYKCVIHKKFTAEEGILEIVSIRKRPPCHNDWFRILMFGLTSVTVGPFSFTTRPVDFGPVFLLGCAVGFMQVKVVPKSEHFSNVFEVFACVLIAFICRALGSVRGGDGDYLFCFSGMAQSSIAMLLPGFLVLNSALELQGRNIVSGSVRMVYAIVYVLFLGFGLLIGTVVFGLMKRDAVDTTTCQVPDWFSPGDSYKLLYTRFVWAPLFACTLALIYQARWRQLPVQALIAVAGHQAYYWIGTQLKNNSQVATALGSFVIGCLANLYSRIFHGLAAASMLPAIYCLVPGGLAASGSLIAGINSSNQIVGSDSSTSTASTNSGANGTDGGTIFNVGYGMVQVAIGISCGLYLSALVVYPFGKRRSGLFSF